MRRWECSECGAWVERSRAPSRCRRCGAAGAVFIASDEDDGASESMPEALYERWVRHGMRTTRHWRAHA